MKKSLAFSLAILAACGAQAGRVTIGTGGDYSTLADALDYAVSLGGTDLTEIELSAGTYAVPQRDIAVPVRICAAAGNEVKLDFNKLTYTKASPCLRITAPASSIENVVLFRTGENSLYMENGASIKNCNVIDGYTQTGGTAKGGAIYLKNGGVMEGGRVSNCSGSYVYQNPVVTVDSGSKMYGTLFEANLSRHYLVYVSGAESVVSNCVFRDNKFSGAGGTNPDYRVMNIAGGTVTHCRFIGNGRSDSTFCREGTVRLNGAAAILRNSILIGNAASSAPGIWVDNGTVENCTVVAGIKNVDRTATAMDLKLKSGTVRNCIFYSAPGVDTVDRTGGSLTYSLTPVAEAGEGNITEIPLFNDAENGDYSLVFGSPCRNAGQNQPWMGQPI